MYNTQSREWRTWDRGRCCIKVLGSLTQYIILALIEGGDEHVVFSFSSVQSLSDVWLFETSWTTACQASLSIANSRVYSNSCPLSQWCHPTICHPLLLLPSVFPSIRVFSNESALLFRWPKYWSFSFSISPSNEYLGLISFRMDWFNLLDVQGTLKSLLQHHSSKASILRHSAFFIVQLSHPYITTGKTRAFSRWTLLAK